MLTPKKLVTLALLALMTTPLASTLLADGPDDGKKIVIKRRICPEIKIGGGSNVHFLGYSNQAFLGVELTNLTPELRSHFGVPGDAGVMVSRVVKESAAEAAGLAVGDIITHVNGEEVASSGALGRAIRSQEGGTEVDLQFWRQGALRQATATLAEHERCAFDVGELMEGIDFERLGDIDFDFGEDMLEGLREALDGQDWGKHFEGLQHLNLEGLEGLEERMEQVQERLKVLEQKLEHEHRSLQRDRERVERDRSQAEREREKKSSTNGGGAGAEVL